MVQSKCILKTVHAFTQKHGLPSYP